MDTTMTIREPRPYWSGISDEKLTEAGVEYRAKAHLMDEPGLLLKLALDIDDELERREGFRARLMSR